VVEHETPAATPPKRTVISPLLLNRPVPVRVTTCPGRPELGVTAAMTGLPGGAGGGGVVVGGAVRGTRLVVEGRGGTVVTGGEIVPNVPGEVGRVSLGTLVVPASACEATVVAGESGGTVSEPAV